MFGGYHYLYRYLPSQDRQLNDLSCIERDIFDSESEEKECTFVCEKKDFC